MNQDVIDHHNCAKIRVMRCPISLSTDVYVLADDVYGGPMALGTSITMTEIEPQTLVGDPTFRMQDDAVQSLMDNLWSCGFRPTEGSGSAGSLAATQAHLADLRGQNEKLLDSVLRSLAWVQKGHNDD